MLSYTSKQSNCGKQLLIASMVENDSCTSHKKNSHRSVQTTAWKERKIKLVKQLFCLEEQSWLRGLGVPGYSTHPPQLFIVGCL